MLRGSFIVRPTCCLVVAALVVASLAPRAPADQIEVSLNVLYSNVADPLSGGSWEIAAKSDGFGIAGLQLLLTGTTAGSEQLVAPRGFVNGTDPAGMSLLDSFNLAGFREVDIIQRQVAVLDGGEEQSIFYGIGTLTNGSPDFPGAPMGSNSIGPVFSSLTNTVGLPWASVPPGDVLGDPSWDSAAVLVTGTFSAGVTPDFYTDATHVSSGNLYTSLGTSTTVGTQTLIESLMTTVRTNLLSVFPDYNDNGFVDAADYTVWRDAMTAGTPLFNDATPGTVDEDDFLFWRQYFGAVVPGFGGGSAAGAGAGLAAAAVPEPTTWTLLLGAVGMLLLRPRIGLLRNVRVR